MFPIPISPINSRLPYVIGMAAGIIGIIISLYFASASTAAKDWPTVTATYVTDAASNQPGSKMLSYRYSVDNKSYTAQSFHPAIAQGVDPTVQVAYDPLNPSHGVVKSDNKVILIMAFLFCAAMTGYSFFCYIGGEQVNIGSQARY